MNNRNHIPHPLIVLNDGHHTPHLLTTSKDGIFSFNPSQIQGQKTSRSCKTMDKAAVFIDGGYIRKIIKHQFSGQEIDYQKLSEVMCKKLKVFRLRSYFYHCMPLIRKRNKKDFKKYRAMEKFIGKLKRLPRFEVKLGRLQAIGGIFKQKMVDILMSLDIVDMCFDKQVDQAILIAGDSDFVPAVRKAKEYGTIVHLVYHPCSVHNELLDEIDEAHEISQDLINNCKMKNLQKNSKA